MPRWKWRLISIGLVIGSVGLVSQVAAFLNTPHDPVFPQHSQVVRSDAAPPSSSSGQSRGFVDATPTSPQTFPASPDLQPDPVAPWKPFMTKFGFSLFVGVAVGTIFRTFLRGALLLTGLIAAAAAGLSYYHVVNVDMTAVNHEATVVTGWMSDQGMRLKDMLFSHLPSSTAAGVGFFFGLRKR